MPYLQENLGMNLDKERFTDPSLEEIDLPAPRVQESLIGELEDICGENNVSTGKFDRVSRSMGKSYRD